MLFIHSEEVSLSKFSLKLFHKLRLDSYQQNLSQNILQAVVALRCSKAESVP